MEGLRLTGAKRPFYRQAIKPSDAMHSSHTEMTSHAIVQKEARQQSRAEHRTQRHEAQGSPPTLSGGGIAATVVLQALLDLRHQGLAGLHEPLGAALQRFGSLLSQVTDSLLGILRRRLAAVSMQDAGGRLCRAILLTLVATPSARHAQPFLQRAAARYMLRCFGTA